MYSVYCTAIGWRHEHITEKLQLSKKWQLLVHYPVTFEEEEGKWVYLHDSLRKENGLEDVV